MGSRRYRIQNGLLDVQDTVKSTLVCRATRMPACVGAIVVLYSAPAQLDVNGRMFFPRNGAEEVVEAKVSSVDFVVRKGCESRTRTRSKYVVGYAYEGDNMLTLPRVSVRRLGFD